MQEPHSPLGQGNNGEKTHGTNPALCRQKTQTNKKTHQFSAKFGGAQGAPKLPRDSSQVSVGRLEPVATSSAGSSLLPPRVPPQPSLRSAGVCATSSSLGSSLSSSAVQEPSLSGLACQAGTSLGCGPPGFMALISRQPDLDTAGFGSRVPMESATQEAAKPFLCAGRKGALLACPGGQRESRALGPWESKRTNEAQQQKKTLKERQSSQEGGKKKSSHSQDHL